MATAKPLDNSETLKNRGSATLKPVAGVDEHVDDTDSTTVSNLDDFNDTYSPDENISEDLISGEANYLATNLRLVFNEIEHRVTTLKPDSVKPAILPAGLKPGNKKLDSLLTTLEPGSWMDVSLITTLQPVRDGNAGSFVTSLESGSGGPDSWPTTLESGIVPTTLDIGYGEPGSLSTTLEDYSGRRGSSATAPEPRDSPNPLPVKNGHRNGTTFIRSSFVVVLLGIFLITGLHVT